MQTQGAGNHLLPLANPAGFTLARARGNRIVGRIPHLRPSLKTPHAFALLLASLARLAIAAESSPNAGPADTVQAANVRAFGAIGNGIADDTAALQAALLSPHQRIYVPAGAYRLTNTLRIPSGKRLTLASAATMTRHSRASAMLVNLSNGSIAGYDAGVDIVVEGGTWDANGTTFADPCTVMAFGHTSGVIVRDCVIQNVPGWHGIELNASRRALVERVRFDRCPSEAIQLDTMNSASPGVFPWFGPYDNAKCRDIMIQDCSFDRTATALGSHSAPAVEGLIVRRCVVNGSAAVAISTNGYFGVIVEECHFNRCHSVYRGATNGLVFRRNEIVESIVSDVDLTNTVNGLVEENVIVGMRTGFVRAPASTAVRNNRFETSLVAAMPRLLSGVSTDRFHYLAVEATPGAQPVHVNSVSAGGSASVAITAGDITTLSVLATGTPPLSYQWYRGDVPIARATAAVYVIDSATHSSAGVYTVRVANSAGTVVSAPIELFFPAAATVPTDWAALTNLSARAYLPSGQAPLSAGFVIRGASGKVALLRGVGPALRNFGVETAVSAATLELFDDRGTTIAASSSWPAPLAIAFNSVGAFPLPDGSMDSALMATLPSGAGTVSVRSPGAGVALIEIFDASPGRDSRFINLSARGVCGPGESALIAGFTVGGSGRMRVLIRAVGPSLAQFGVAGAQANLRLEVYSAGALLATNERWSEELTPAFASVGAFPLAAGSGDAALTVDVASGSTFTALARSTDGRSGEVLLELFDYP